jgi:hypothetical protein
MQIKNIQFRQSGGFAGLVRGAEVSADEGISETERRALERHAQGTRATPAPGAARARDLVMYELTLETDAGPVRLEFDEMSVPDDLTALVEELARRAKPVKP